MGAIFVRVTVTGSCGWGETCVFDGRLGVADRYAILTRWFVKIIPYFVVQRVGCLSLRKASICLVFCALISNFAPNMKEVRVKDAALQQAAAEGMDAFVQVFIDGIRAAIGGELTAESMAELNADQVTLLAWDTLHEEVMDGGFVQLIHNGYGPFIFKNPFAKAMKLWGLRDLSKLIYDAHSLWLKHREQIERELTEEEFMALFEQMPEFDDLDDAFIENEEEWTSLVAHYVDEHIENFATIEQ